MFNEIYVTQRIITLEDVAVLGHCCSANHDSSLYLLILFFLWS